MAAPTTSDLTTSTTRTDDTNRATPTEKTHSVLKSIAQRLTTTRRILTALPLRYTRKRIPIGNTIPKRQENGTLTSGRNTKVHFLLRR